VRPPLTWNPGSAPDIDLNMYIINVIADDESKINFGINLKEVIDKFIWTIELCHI
jgi:hypothetical protein